uniref:Col_cuticle_N domain-containing protein n=1 Tax=Parastrongyloides trichosuri TaxID=131310 RepID=A0A0N4ZJ70_PARTI
MMVPLKGNLTSNNVIRLTMLLSMGLILFHYSFLTFLITKLDTIEVQSKNDMIAFEVMWMEVNDQFNNYYGIKNKPTRLVRESLFKCSCNTDFKCPPGPEGMRGEDGSNGFPGSKGIDGEVGLPFQGYMSSIEEYDGHSCRICPKGPPGLPGDRGPPGSQGLPGMKGLNGMEGRPAGIGITGIIGEVGEPGEAGNVGPIGFKGMDSYRGIQGPKGMKGRKGVIGMKGEMGYPGYTGKSGPQGMRGKEGSKGINGMEGMNGRYGMPGMPGTIGTDGGYCKCLPSSEVEIINTKNNYNQNKLLYVNDESFNDRTPIYVEAMNDINIKRNIRNLYH